ncbi:hypothetical protein CYMTET_40683 [Cymbomonas tetramitiformis]|uniref:Uncharacterized protein n=1 Tax=Cymbomonas tetramitiformis TaxID=36881 RepID=A0AAE0F4D7_9CHLO|nr:hypothetical protein CYMTET_40683 [Cymbomonas tetramitiformis]
MGGSQQQQQQQPAAEKEAAAEKAGEAQQQKQAGQGQRRGSASTNPNEWISGEATASGRGRQAAEMAGEAQQQKQAEQGSAGESAGGSQQQQQPAAEKEAAAEKAGEAQQQKQAGQGSAGESASGGSQQQQPAMQAGEAQEQGLEDPSPVEVLTKQFHEVYFAKKVRQNFMSFTTDGVHSTSIPDNKRCIVDVQEGTAFMKRLEGVGADVMSTLTSWTEKELVMRTGPMGRTLLMTAGGAARQDNHYDAGEFGVLLVISDQYQLRVYPGSHLCARELLDSEGAPDIAHVARRCEERCDLFGGAGAWGWSSTTPGCLDGQRIFTWTARARCCPRTPRTFPVFRKSGPDKEFCAVDTTELLPFSQRPLASYAMRALKAEMDFVTVSPSLDCLALGHTLEDSLKLRNTLRGDVAFGRVVAHLKHLNLFWISFAPARGKTAQNALGVCVYGPWLLEENPAVPFSSSIRGGRRTVWFRHSVLNSSAYLLHQSEKVEARSNIEHYLVEAVEDFKELVVKKKWKPVRHFNHHKRKEDTWMYEGELIPVHYDDPPANAESMAGTQDTERGR